MTPNYRLFNVLSLIWLLAGQAAAQTVTRGPYLQTGTPTSVTVKWRTSSATNSVVRYGLQQGNLNQSASVAGSFTNHEVVVNGLAPATKYYYSAGNTTGPLAGGDSSHFFTTAPSSGTSVPTRVWVLGDSGTADANARAVRDAFAAYTGSQNPNLMLMLGDNAYEDGTDAEFQTAVFDTYPQFLRNTVLWPTLGNHDGHTADSASQSGPYYDIFTLPKNGQSGGVASGTEAYYSFDHGDIHFVCLESYETDRSTSGAMMTWLEADLEANDKPWLVAFWHHPPYSKGSHDSDTDSLMTDMRQNALPILEQHGVDLVLTGHSHSYERSYLIDGHYGVSSTFSNAMKKAAGNGNAAGSGAYVKPLLADVPHEGAVYAVAGASGSISGGPLNHPAMVLSLNALGSVVLDFSAGRLDVKYLDNNANVRDDFTIVKGADSTPPAISSVVSEGPTTAVIVTYTERVEETSAEATGNYAINNGVTVSAAVLDASGRVVTLTTAAPLNNSAYTLTINNVVDLAANPIAPNSQAVFNHVDVVTQSFQNGVSPSAGYAGTTDTYISANAPTSNFGTATSLLVDGDDPAGSGNDLAALLRWDLSPIPAGSTIINAEIDIEVFNVSTGAYQVYELKRGWAQTSATWNLASAGNPWQTAGAAGSNDRASTVLGTVTASALGSYKILLNADGLDALRRWAADPSSNFGLIMANSATTDGLDFRSSEYATAAQRPRLTVRYSAAGDTEAPTAPGGLSLVSKTSTQVQVQWNASSDNVGVDHYRVLRNGAEVGLPSVAAFTDTGLTANTAYQYAVSAVDAAGNESGLSSALNVTTNPATTPKVHVSGISIQRLSTARQRYARAVISLADAGGAPVGGANVAAQWSGLANDSENGATTSAGSVQFDSNRVDRSASGQFIITVTGVSANGFSYDSAANAQTTACVGINGTVCSVGPPDTTPPSAPGPLTASPGPGSVSLNWPDNTTDGDWADFIVYRSTVSGSGYSAIASGLTASQYVDSGLAADVPVYYVVTSRDASGNESGASNQASATPSQPPAQSIRVSAIVVSVSKLGKSYQGLATVTVRNQNNALVGNVQVTGVWDHNGSGIGTASATTSAGGAAALSSAKIKAAPGDVFRFTVTNLSLAGYTYNAGANTETSDSAVAP